MINQNVLEKPHTFDTDKLSMEQRYEDLSEIFYNGSPFCISMSTCTCNNDSLNKEWHPQCKGKKTNIG